MFKSEYSERFCEEANRVAEKHEVYNSLSKLSKALGKSTNLFTDFKSGKSELTFPLLRKACEELGFDKDYILTGERNRNKKQEHETIPEIENMSIYRLKTDYYTTNRRRIPLYELRASAGLNTLFDDQNNQLPLDFITIPNAPKVDGALPIKGDSMYPVLKAGDIICFKMILDFKDIRFGEMYLLDIEDNSDRYLTVKYVQKSDIGDDYVKLVSQNSYHQPKDEPIKNIKAIAIVKVSIRYNTIS